MLYFGSRNFGQANFGKGLIQTAVDETLTTSNMDVAGYLLFNTGTLIPKSVTNVDIAAGIQRMGFLSITPTATVIASKLLMEWHPSMANISPSNTTLASGYVAWDSQLIDDAVWSEIIVD